MKNRKKILILDAQAVQTLIIVEQLRKADYVVDLFCDSKINYGYYTRFSNNSIVAPKISDEECYLYFLISYIKDNGVDALIPMTDESACFLSKNSVKLKKYVAFIMPGWDIFTRAYDKNKLMTLCHKKGYPHPRTIDFSVFNYKSITSSDINFPALIKPNYTTGGRGMTLVNSVEDLLDKYPGIYDVYGDCHLQEYIAAGGRQIKVQIFIDPKTSKKFSSVIYKQRYYPETGGSSCCNITIADDSVVELCCNVLDDIDWVGFADFDLIEDPKDGILKIMEINPRIPACIKSAIKSGVDYATLIANASLGEELRNYCYVPGKKLRHIGFELLWFFYSKNRFNTKPNWFNFFSRNLYFQDFSIKDPIPFFVGTFGNFKKQLNSNFRKSKSGLR